LDSSLQRLYYVCINVMRCGVFDGCSCGVNWMCLYAAKWLNGLRSCVWWRLGEARNVPPQIRCGLHQVTLVCCLVEGTAVHRLVLCNTPVARCSTQLIGPADWTLSHWDHYTVINLEAVTYSSYGNTVEWFWWDWSLSQRPTDFLQCFDAVNWVIWPVKIVPKWSIKCRVGC